MSSITIICGPRHGILATEKYPGLNPCMFHGHDPVVEEEQKKKGTRYVNTDFAEAYCQECAGQDLNRIIYAHVADIRDKWNQHNPVFASEQERKTAVLTQLWKERDEYAKLLAEARKEVDRLELEVQVKEGLIYLI